MIAIPLDYPVGRTARRLGWVHLPPRVRAEVERRLGSAVVEDHSSEAGFTPDRVDVTAEVSLDNVPPAGWTVTASHLTLKAKIPGIDQAKFDEIAAKAKAGCPISRLLNAKITLAATLG